MTVAGDIARDEFRKQFVAVLALLGMGITNDQAIIAGLGLEGMRHEAITQLLLTNQPPEDARTGIILQMLCSGKTREMGFRVQEVVQLVLAILKMASTDSGFAKQLKVHLMKDAIMAIQPDSFALGRQEWYSAPPDAFKAAFMRDAASKVPPESLFAAVGLSPRHIGSGFRGLEELKGNVGFSNVGPGVTRTPGQTANHTDMMRSIGAYEDAE